MWVAATRAVVGGGRGAIGRRCGCRWLRRLTMAVTAVAMACVHAQVQGEERADQDVGQGAKQMRAVLDEQEKAGNGQEAQKGQPYPPWRRGAQRWVRVRVVTRH